MRASHSTALHPQVLHNGMGRWTAELPVARNYAHWRTDTQQDLEPTQRAGQLAVGRLTVRPAIRLGVRPFHEDERSQNPGPRGAIGDA